MTQPALPIAQPPPDPTASPPPDARLLGGDRSARVRGRGAAGLRGLGIVVVAVATALALLGLALPLFLNPAWVSFEQDRSRADALTGFQPDELHRITGSLLHDLVVGPPSFDVRDDAGRLVLADAEQSHLRDVRAVMSVALVVFVVAAVAVVLVGLAARRRRSYWRGVRAGARLLAASVIVLGGLSLVAFDTMFDLFHRLFFAAGTYTFDPNSSRLVQLFPDQFWLETTIAIGLVLLALAWDVNRLATRRIERLALTSAPDDAGARGAPARAAEPAGPAGAVGR